MGFCAGVNPSGAVGDWVCGDGLHVNLGVCGMGVSLSGIEDLWEVCTLRAEQTSWCDVNQPQFPDCLSSIAAARVPFPPPGHRAREWGGTEGGTDDCKHREGV